MTKRTRACACQKMDIWTCLGAHMQQSDISQFLQIEKYILSDQQQQQQQLQLNGDVAYILYELM